MSDEDRPEERDDKPDEDPAEEPSRAGDDPGLETGESGSLGLTEEFARIEAEIENDLAPSPAEPESGEPEPGEPGPAEPESAEPGPAEPEPAEPEPVEPDPVVPGPAEPEPVEPDLVVPGPAEPESAEPEPVEPPRAADDDGARVETDEWVVAAEADGEGAEAAEPDDGAGTGEEIAAEAEEPTVVSPAPMPRPLPQDAAEQHPIVKPMPRAVVPVGAAAEEDLADMTPTLWWRFLLGSVLIIASVSTSVAVAAILEVTDIAQRLQPIPGVGKQLSAVESDKPQTILIVGSDKRSDAPKGTKGLSDTTMLLRVDPEKDVLSLFSLPRDLKVDIPGVGVAKLNEAYSAGGSKKTLETVKAFTGVEINHIVEINFQAFADAVNAVGCVYIDIDRDYFHSNEGLPVSEHYSEIDINSGYQRLCGLKALQFVRFRHTDTDLVRAARQQDFLREARQKVQPNELLPAFGGTGNDLIDIFTEHVDSDIDNAADVIGILKSFIAVRNVPVNEVHFEGDIGGPTDPFVTSTDSQVENAISEFYNGGASSGLRGGDEANKSRDQKKSKKKNKGKKKDKEKDKTPQANVLEADPQFAKYAGTADRRLNFPIFYPTRVVPGSEFSRDSRTYEYNNEEDKREAAFKYVISLSNPSTLIEYYGVMGTTWNDPPILRNPSEVREIDGREYLLFYDGGRLRMVGWKQRGNSYWLSNTLVQSIGEAEMLEMATTMKEL